MKSILLLVNPFAGYVHTGYSKTHYLPKIVEKLEKEAWQVEIVESTRKGYFTDFLPTKNLENMEAIGVLGGDGTMHEVLNGLMKCSKTPPVLLFPLGTGNAFNHDLDALTVEKALANLKKDKTMSIDLMQSNQGFWAFNIIGFGLVSYINELAEKTRFLGKFRYDLMSIIGILKNPSFQATVYLDDKKIEDTFSFILACNTKHTGKGMKMAPLAELNDGLVDVLLVRHTSRLNLLRIFPKVFKGTHLTSPLLEYHQVASFEIEAEQSKLNVDGEMLGTSPIEVKVVRDKVKVFVG